jgi:hypothetical protein
MKSKENFIKTMLKITRTHLISTCLGVLTHSNENIDFLSKKMLKTIEMSLTNIKYVSILTHSNVLC